MPRHMVMLLLLEYHICCKVANTKILLKTLTNQTVLLLLVCIIQGVKQNNK